MARFCALSLCHLVALSAVIATQVTTDEERRTSMMRRQKSSHMYLGPAGDLEMHEDGDKDSQDDAPVSDSKKDKKESKKGDKKVEGSKKDKSTDEGSKKDEKKSTSIENNSTKHDTNSTKAVESGEGSTNATNSTKHHKYEGVKTIKKTDEVSWCDTSYLEGTSNSNTCVKGYPVTREEDCRHAADKLKFPVGAADFLVDDDLVNPNPYPKNCFVLNGTVHFNPTESVRTSGWEGTPLCSMPTYIDAQLDPDDPTVAASCSGDYVAVTKHEECMFAHDCTMGMMFCQEPEIANASYTTTQAPKGCYRDELGCYGFNANEVNMDATWKVTGKTSVCRLKTHIFGGGNASTGKNASS